MELKPLNCCDLKLIHFNWVEFIQLNDAHLWLGYSNMFGICATLSVHKETTRCEQCCHIGQTLVQQAWWLLYQKLGARLPIRTILQSCLLIYSVICAQAQCRCSWYWIDHLTIWTSSFITTVLSDHVVSHLSHCYRFVGLHNNYKLW